MVQPVVPYDFQAGQRALSDIANLRARLSQGRATTPEGAGLNLLAEYIAKRGEGKKQAEHQEQLTSEREKVLSGIRDVRRPPEVGPTQGGTIAEVLAGSPVYGERGIEMLIAQEIAGQKAEAEQGGAFAGSGLTNQAWNIVLDPNVDPSSETAQAAYSIISQPKTSIDSQSGQLVTMSPNIPPTIMQKFSQGGGVTVSEEPVVPRTQKFAEGENKAAGFFTRMRDTEGVLEEIEETEFDPTGFKSALYAGFDSLSPDIISRATMPDVQKRYLNTALNFVTAVLRRESGAAISVDEFEKEYKKYFPQFGDGPDSVGDKKRLRQTAMTNMFREGKGPLASEGITLEETEVDWEAGLDADKKAALIEGRAMGIPEDELKAAVLGE